jgi:hypothetical protein
MFSSCSPYYTVVSWKNCSICSENIPCIEKISRELALKARQERKFQNEMK